MRDRTLEQWTPRLLQKEENWNGYNASKPEVIVEAIAEMLKLISINPAALFMLKAVLLYYRSSDPSILLSLPSHP